MPEEAPFFRTRGLLHIDSDSQTHGGYGFAREFDIERKFRETRLYRVAPISSNLILSYVGTKLLGMPKSY